MAKSVHEFRDPIHVFIRVTNRERKIVDSGAFQRLRSIHQLALTHYVYPGATHKRFEHSLGVLHLADSAFEVLVRNLKASIAGAVAADLENSGDRENARSHLRMAALLHDVGHFPFSHVGEEGGLLPKGWDHEAMSIRIVTSEPMRSLLREAGVDPHRVARICVGESAWEYAETLGIEERELRLNNVDILLSEIITGDFGVDRMDYLLRDSHHTGVPYGKFDHHRLIDSFRLVADPREESRGRPKIAIQQGGVLCAHHLLLARYYMFSQVYLHPVRQAYDFHLRDFFKKSLTGGLLPVDVKNHLELSDIEIEGMLRKSQEREARMIVNRSHVRVVHQTNSLHAGEAREFRVQLQQNFPNALTFLSENKAKKVKEFLVLDSKDEVQSSLGMADLNVIPASAPHYVFIDRENYDAAISWKALNLPKILDRLRAKREREAKRQVKKRAEKGARDADSV